MCGLEWIEFLVLLPQIIMAIDFSQLESQGCAKNISIVHHPF
jgi:hypothetical protein